MESFCEMDVGRWLFADRRLLKFYCCSPKQTPEMILFTHLQGCFDFYVFEKDSALTHIDREMVEFLAFFWLVRHLTHTFKVTLS